MLQPAHSYLGIRKMGNVAHLLNPRTRERATTVEGSAGVPPAATRHQQMGIIAHLTTLSACQRAAVGGAVQ